MNNVLDSFTVTGKTFLRQKRLLGKLLTILPHSHNLNVLALKHGTDKWRHGYTEYYEKHFGPLRRRKLNILEIGVGGYDDPSAGGASLRMWQEYFPNSMIYAIDLEDKSRHEDKRIRIFRGSQNDLSFLQEVARQIGEIHIIVDDGSHISAHVITSFRALFPHLSDGGVYVIEDLHTAYKPKYGGSWENLNNPATSMAMLKGLLDGLHYEYIPNRPPTYFDQHIVSMVFHPKIAFIFKGQNNQATLNLRVDKFFTRVGRLLAAARKA